MHMINSTDAIQGCKRQRERFQPQNYPALSRYSSIRFCAKFWCLRCLLQLIVGEEATKILPCVSHVFMCAGGAREEWLFLHKES